MSGPDGFIRQRRPGPGEAWALGRRGAAAGVLAAVPVDALLLHRRMVEDHTAGGTPVVVALVLYGPLIGAAIGVTVGHRRRNLAAAASGGVMVGLLSWLLWSLTLGPVLHGTQPTWSLDAASVGYPELVADLLHGGLSGLILQGVLGLWPIRPRVRHERESPPLSRVLIVGGGFAGVSTARRLERHALRGAAIDVTLVGESNFLLFTPMLAEVASGALEPGHISAPVRAAVAHTRFLNRAVVTVDTDRRTVLLAANSGPPESLEYDHLVLAVGSVPQFLGLPGVAENALTLKNLNDAILLRNRVLTLLEQADSVGPDPEDRQRLLTFVVAGGGFAGAETIAELFDLVHGVLRYFPGIAPGEPRFVLIHSRDRILPELSSELGDYALQRLRARGIEFRLGVRVAGATEHDVRLDDGELIPTSTFVWTAGNRPGPLVANIGGLHAKNGALITDTSFRAQGLDRVWALGDCARIPDVDSDGEAFPPTAQHAIRQGTVLADNIVAAIAGRALTEFRFRTIGVLVALGHRTAAAEIRGHRFSGLAAWLMWRGIYLAKLPGIEKRLRVLLDWTLDLVFPRDIVVTAPVPTREQPPDRTDDRAERADALTRGPAS